MSDLCFYFDPNVSLTELGKGGNHWCDVVIWVSEWWAVPGAPWELGGYPHWNGVLDQVLRSKVSNFILGWGIGVNSWEELAHFVHAYLGWVTDVVECLNLLQVHEVVAQPKLVVVLHGRVQLLHQLRPTTASCDSSIDLVLSLHEFVVLLSDFVDNIGSMDWFLIGFPVDGCEWFGTPRLFVIVVEDWWQLTLHLSRLIGGSCNSKSIQPFCGQFVIYTNFVISINIFMDWH